MTTRELVASARHSSCTNLDVCRYYRVVAERDRFSCGLLATVEGTLTLVTVMDTQTRYLLSQSQVLLREGKYILRSKG